MGESTRAILQFLILVLVGAIALALWVPVDQTQKIMLSGALGISLLFCVALLVDGYRRKDRAPDFFKERGMPRPFEYGGLTFLPVFADDGSPRIDVYFQNRYSRPCRGTVHLLPPHRTLSFRRLPLPKVDVPFEVGGAEFAVLHLPYDVPPEYRGKTLTFDVAAKVGYPEGRGKLIRFRQGLRVQSPQGGGSAVISVLAACVGILYLSQPARVRLTLPSLPCSFGQEYATRRRSLWVPSPDQRNTVSDDVSGLQNVA